MSDPSEQDERFTSLKKRFFDDWIAAEPEEATTLGLAEEDGRLRDPSPQAAASGARRARAVLDELDALDARGWSTDDDRFDAWALRAHASERVLAAERGRPETDVEAVPYVIMMLAHAAAHATTDARRRTVSRRIEAIPRYVADVRSALAEGARSGRPFSTAVLGAIDGQLSSARADLAEIVRAAYPNGDARTRASLEAADRAADAVVAFAAFLRETVATSPGAREVVPIGEGEYRRRLDSWWRLGSLDEIRRRARDELDHARAEMIELAARSATASSAPTRTFADAKRRLDEILAPRPNSPEAIVPLYEREIARAIDFCREHRVFAIPEVCRCEVIASPELWRRFAPCTNWPAPLLGGDAPGSCAVVLDPALHPLANIPGLAVHEAVPGHFLQSRRWQQRFGPSKAPVRFLSVPDECGVLRGAWIPHFMIEGWAVLAEATMADAGFYDDVTLLFHSFCRTIHAARALADIGTHVDGWPRQQTMAFLAEATGMPPSACAHQSVRYARSGLQALGYLIGRLAIEDVRAAEKRKLGAAYDELAFQDKVLDAGPVPPALLFDELRAPVR